MRSRRPRSAETPSHGLRDDWINGEVVFVGASMMGRMLRSPSIRDERARTRTHADNRAMARGAPPSSRQSIDSNGGFAILDDSHLFGVTEEVPVSTRRAHASNAGNRRGAQ